MPLLLPLSTGSSKKHPLDAVSMGSIGRSASLHFVPKCQTHKPMSAEFRIHKRVTNMEKLPEQCRRTIEDSGISVQLWISDERKGNRTVEFVRHIRTQQVLLLGQQWVLFKDLQDVTGDWFRNSSQCGKMKSIYITLGEGCAGVDPALLGFDTGNTSGTHEQPFFSIFTKNEDEENTHSLLGKGPLNITEILEQKRRERKDVSSVYAQYLQDRVRMEISEQKKNSCQAYDFRVSVTCMDTTHAQESTYIRTWSVDTTIFSSSCQCCIISFCPQLKSVQLVLASHLIPLALPHPRLTLLM